MMIHVGSAGSDGTGRFIVIHDESEGPAPHRAKHCATRNPNKNAVHFFRVICSSRVNWEGGHVMYQGTLLHPWAVNK